eukprot:CAMPEP_0181180410 /NCGR_PEP_ID=MMETSP1096-20121128/6781_1 /TAXON_ID=156174 ORGANISM="Chrysochromulina ericina, Strain CCMP281" /NCGR_SAMPLE_ID=MMETSP1096 /ASSEMBLY_ACC=CAM_ASM_000453 /LENGTH=105 /DNA_ID=CAMNT_0023268829 /DNA_START=303 /DNA_END=620 /DNA_ORIENTATION=-
MESRAPSPLHRKWRMVVLTSARKQHQPPTPRLNNHPSCEPALVATVDQLVGERVGEASLSTDSWLRVGHLIAQEEDCGEEERRTLIIVRVQLLPLASPNLVRLIV